MSLAGLPVFDDGRLVEIIPLSNSADPDSNKDAPLKVGFVNGFLSLSLGGAPSVKYTYQSGGSQINVASNDGPLLIFYDDRIGDSILEGGKLGDFIYGGSGNDILRGGEGDDTLMGNLGINIIQGGSGSNTASYVGYDGPNSPDTLGVEVFSMNARPTIRRASYFMIRSSTFRMSSALVLLICWSVTQVIIFSKVSMAPTSSEVDPVSTRRATKRHLFLST